MRGHPPAPGPQPSGALPGPAPLTHWLTSGEYRPEEQPAPVLRRPVGRRASGPPGAVGARAGGRDGEGHPSEPRDPPRWPLSQAPTISPNVMERGAGPLCRAAPTMKPAAPSPRGQSRASRRQPVLVTSRPPCVWLCQDLFCA